MPVNAQLRVTVLNKLRQTSLVFSSLKKAVRQSPQLSNLVIREIQVKHTWLGRLVHNLRVRTLHATYFPCVAQV